MCKYAHHVYISKQTMTISTFMKSSGLYFTAYCTPLLDSNGFWWWYVTLRFTGFLDSVHCPAFLLHIAVISLRHSLVSGIYTATVMTEMVQWYRLVVTKGFNRVCISSPEDGNRSSFQKVEFSGFVEYRTMDKVQNSNNSECTLLTYS
jgi:hypothetical protein